jgi:hypothetical protein
MDANKANTGFLISLKSFERESKPMLSSFHVAKPNVPVYCFWLEAQATEALSIVLMIAIANSLKATPS